MPRTKATASELPAGFKSANVQGQFGNMHNFEAQPLLIGRCKGIATVKTKNGKQQVMTIEKEDGGLAGVWHSYMLSALFNQKPVRKQVYIRFEGVRKIKGRKEAMKLFSCGVK